MKIKNFIVTAVASIISGLFRVKAKGTADNNSFFVVNPESTTDSTTGTPAKTVKINGSQVFPYNYGMRYYDVPDMSGKPRHILISDITNFWTSPETTINLPKQGFCGFLKYCRDGGYNIDGGAFVECVVSYRNKNKSEDANVLQLRYNPTIVKNHPTGKPCVVKYNERYYLSLYHSYSSTILQLSGAMYNLLPEFQTVLEPDLEVIQEGIIETITDSLTVTGDATVSGLINNVRLRSDIDGGAVSINNIANHPLIGYNIDIGYGALDSVQSGAYENVAIGRYAGYSITTGDSNIAIGYNAGRDIITGDDNIAIGANVYNGAWSNQVLVGHIAHVFFPETATGSDVWYYFEFVNKWSGNEPCLVSSDSFHAFMYDKNNSAQIITLYDLSKNIVKVISNNQNTLGFKMMITCNKLNYLM